VPLSVLGHCDGVKGLCTQAALGPRAAEGCGGLGLHHSLLSPSTFPHATRKPTPFQASLGSPQCDHPNPAWLRALTAGLHLPRRRGPALGHGVAALGWVGSGELLALLSLPLSVTTPSAAWERLFARLGPCCPRSWLQQDLCVSDLLAAAPWADGGVFSEGEGPRGESHPTRARPEPGVPLRPDASWLALCWGCAMSPHWEWPRGLAGQLVPGQSKGPSWCMRETEAGSWPPRLAT